MSLDAFEITGATVKQEEAGFLTVCADGNFFRFFGLVHDHAKIPVHSQNIDAEDVLGLPDRDVGFAQDFFSIFDALFPRNKLGRLPVFLFSFHVNLQFCESYKKPSAAEPQAYLTAETQSSQRSSISSQKLLLLGVLHTSAGEFPFW